MLTQFLLLSPSPALRLDQLPRRFERSSFEAFERSRPGIISNRWGEFVSTTAPLQLETVRLLAAGRLRRDDVSYARAMRESLASLGPTFIKLGQIISVREDVLGPVWSAELARLQDGIQPVASEEALRAIADNFGDAAFESIDPSPVATASIAQVHRAVFLDKDGVHHDVAVKVLRPGVVESVAVDLCVLMRASDIFATWAPRVLPASKVDWAALLLGLAAALWEEVDLDGEARRQARFSENMRSVPRAYVPKVLASTRQAMVSEWIEGVSLRAVTSTSVLRSAVTIMRDAYCQAMFVDGFFHADCHGGNLLWMGDAAAADEGSLCILDCGLMVEIEDAIADGLLRLSLHLAARQWDSVVEDAIQLGFLPPTLPAAQRSNAQGIARRLVGPYLDVGGGAAAASAYSASVLFNDITAASTELPTSLPPQMVLLGRAVIQLEGLALRADPRYRLVDDILPVAAQIALRSGDRSGGGDAPSILFELLYDPADGGTERFAPERLRRLLATAQGAGEDIDTSRNEAALLDLLLDSKGGRDIVSHEAAAAIDALARDTLWKSAARLAEPPPWPLPPLPINSLSPLVRDVAERLVPRLTAEEELVLVRLPTALASAVGEVSSTSTTVETRGETALPSVLGDFALARVANEPAVRSALGEVLRRAVVQADPAARAAVDSVGLELRGRMRKRLEAAGLPPAFADVVRTPWT